jgi:hypothetical protein
VTKQITPHLQPQAVKAPAVQPISPQPRQQQSGSLASRQRLLSSKCDLQAGSSQLYYTLQRCSRLAAAAAAGVAFAAQQHL